MIMFIYQHPYAETFNIDRKGVFKIRKNYKNKKGVAIRSYGDEKLVLKGDFYKSSLRESSFYNGESVPVKFLNSSGINHN